MAPLAIILSHNTVLSERQNSGQSVDAQTVPTATERSMPNGRIEEAGAAAVFWLRTFW